MQILAAVPVPVRGLVQVLAGVWEWVEAVVTVVVADEAVEVKGAKSYTLHPLSLHITCTLTLYKASHKTIMIKQHYLSLNA